MGAQRGDACACPAIAMSRDQAVAVQDAGDEVVVGDQHQLMHGGDNVGRGAVALAAPSPGQAHFAVHAADPVNDENDLGGFRIDIRR